MKKPPLTPDSPHALLVAALERAWEEGNPVGGSSADIRGRVASIVERRWRSLHRRKVSADDPAAVTRDFTAGLIAAFEENSRLVGPLKLDCQLVAAQLLAVILQAQR